MILHLIPHGQFEGIGPFHLKVWGRRNGRKLNTHLTSSKWTIAVARLIYHACCQKKAVYFRTWSLLTQVQLFVYYTAGVLVSREHIRRRRLCPLIVICPGIYSPVCMSGLRNLTPYYRFFIHLSLEIQVL